MGWAIQMTLRTNLNQTFDVFSGKQMIQVLSTGKQIDKQNQVIFASKFSP